MLKAGRAFSDRLRESLSQQGELIKDVATRVVDTQDRLALEVGTRMQRLQHDLTLQGTAMQDTMHELMAMVARQARSPSISSFVGTLFSIRVLEFENTTPSLLSSMTPDISKYQLRHGMQIVEGCPVARPGTPQSCTHCTRFPRHCRAHRPCRWCAGICERSAMSDNGVVLVLTNADMTKTSIRWFRDNEDAEDHLQRTIKHHSGLRHSPSLDEYCQRSGITKYDDSVQVALKLKLPNVTLIRGLLEIEWGRDLSQVVPVPDKKSGHGYWVEDLVDPLDYVPSCFEEGNSLLWHLAPSATVAIRTICQLHEILTATSSAQRFRLRRQLWHYLCAAYERRTYTRKWGTSEAEWDKLDATPMTREANQRYLFFLVNGIVPRPCDKQFGICLPLKPDPIDDPQVLLPPIMQFPRSSWRWPLDSLESSKNEIRDMAMVGHKHRHRLQLRQRRLLSGRDGHKRNTMEDLELEGISTEHSRSKPSYLLTTRPRRRYSSVLTANEMGWFFETRAPVWRMVAVFGMWRKTLHSRACDRSGKVRRNDARYLF